jgi:hypothetical protein
MNHDACFCGKDIGEKDFPYQQDKRERMKDLLVMVRDIWLINQCCMPVDPNRAGKNGSVNQKTNDIKEKLWA